MWNQQYYVVGLVLFSALILREVNFSTSAKNNSEKPPPSNQTKNHPEPEIYDVKKFNGTVLVELENGKEVIPVKVGKKIGKVIVRVGNEKRIHFDVDKSKEKKTAVITLKKYSGNVTLQGGEQTVEIKSNNRVKQTGPPHVGLIYI